MDSKITSLVTYRADRAARAALEKKEERLNQEFRLRVHVGRVHREPYDASPYNKVGLSLYDLRVLDEAEIWFRRALALAREDSEEQDIAILLYNLANTLFEQNSPARNREIRRMLGECINIEGRLVRPSEEVRIRASQIMNKIDAMDGPGLGMGPLD